MRIRRLRSDAELMTKTLTNTGPIRLKSAVGDPPSTYRLEYLVRGLERCQGRDPIIRDNHLVEIELTGDYPRLSPHCKMLTPIFHPNIDTSTICVGDHWTAGERLIDLVVRIGEMIAYQAYNIKSPLNGEAAMWADLNAVKIPIDPRSLRVAEQ
jgi:ubiquitin-protein ligase